MRAFAAEFHNVVLTPEERVWLEKNCAYFKPDYLDYLQAYRFKPDQLHLEFAPIPDDVEKNAQGDPSARGHVHIDAVGPWEETILWEVPLMACLSETYFTTTDTDWDYEGQEGMHGVPPIQPCALMLIVHVSRCRGCI